MKKLPSTIQHISKHIQTSMKIKCELLVNEPNCGNRYCINEIYGLIFSALGKEFEFIYK